MSEVLRYGKVGTQANKTAVSEERSKFQKIALTLGKAAAGLAIVGATALGCSSGGTTTTFTPNKDAKTQDVGQDVYSDVGEDLYVPDVKETTSEVNVKKSCYEKESEGKTIYVIEVGGSKTKVSEGDLVEENGQKYKISITDEGTVTLRAVDAEGNEQSYKVTVGGETFTVYNGETVTYKGETCKVDIDNMVLARLNRDGKEDGVFYDISSVESSDVSKEATSFTTSYYFGKYVVEVSGLEGDLTPEVADRFVLCERKTDGCNTLLSIKGVDGVTGTIELTDQTDFEGNQIATYSYQVPGESNNLGPFEVSMVPGAKINMGENVSIVVKAAGPKVQGDTECLEVVANFDVTEDGKTVSAHVPEGHEIPVLASTLKVGNIVPGVVGKSPYCVEETLTTPTADTQSPMVNSGVFCEGDEKNLSRDEGTATVKLKGVYIQAGSQ